MELTIGNYLVLIDREDLDLVKGYKWQYHIKTGIMCRANKKTVYMHRLIMSAPKGAVVDHINHNHFDNRRVNLRLCTQSQNSKNQQKPKNNTSGYKGVQFENRKELRKKWRAIIKVNRKNKCLGRYHTAEEAAEAYNKAAIDYFGEFACINIIKV